MTNDVTTSLRELVERFGRSAAMLLQHVETATVAPHPGWLADCRTDIMAGREATTGLMDDKETLAFERDEFASKATNWEICSDSWKARALSAEGEVERLKAALEQGAQWFDEYAEMHLAKPDYDKAARNTSRATFLRLSIGKGNGEVIPGPVTNADAACSLRETLVPGEEGQL